jgi:glycosyltransferase involved in cell wall biosynthesis
LNRVALVHHTLLSMGGGERVCASIIEALNRLGNTPDLLTIEGADPKLDRIYGKNIRYGLKPLLRFRIGVLGIYQRLVLSMATSFAAKNYDTVINTTGVFTPFPVKHRRYFSVIYNPNIALHLFGEGKYSTSLLWRLYYEPYRLLVQRSLGFLRSSKVISISEYTAKRLQKLGIHSVVIPGPLDTREFKPLFENKKRDGVITIGRFTPEKRHLDQLTLARSLPDIRFRICGSANTPYYQHWFQQIYDRGSKIENVEFYPNTSLQELKNLIGRSKIFLHTNFFEDLGLTTLEATAGGCIPIVPDSGGNQETVPIRQLRYRTLEEAKSLVRIRHDGRNSEFLRERLLQYVSRFDESVFQDDILSYVQLNQ